ncbi:MAG: hypothetical protein J1F66_05285 [Clostridiales bacterium]|nr:hypothetical protein [Clostridiales bacterium]
MKKNDDNIQKLFDDYAEDLNERNDLAEKARLALVEQNAKKDKQQRKPKMWNWLAPVCAALIIVVVSVSIWSPFNSNGGGTFGPSGLPNQSGQGKYPSVNINYYASSDVKGRGITLSDCDETLKISNLLLDDEYTVVSEHYYAFYFDDGNLAYIKAILGVRSEEGFCEIVIIAEADGVVRQDLSDFYDDYIYGRNYATMHTVLDDKGEYVTNAYFNARNSHFYVSAMTGANSTLAEKIISEIL